MAFGVSTKRVSNSEAQDRFKAKRRSIERRPREDPKRRARLEAIPEAWLMHYIGANSFPFPFSSAHKAMIREAVASADTGTGSAVAAPRGEGKTTVFRAVAFYLVAIKKLKFPVLVGWKHGDAKAALKLWLRMLTQSKEFQADYPEFTQPFEVTTHSAAMKNLTWADTGENIGANVDSSDKMITFPDSIGAIAARSAQGDAKGLNAVMIDGTILRPDFVLFDDTQDPDRADNPVAVADTVDNLENVFLGMAGPQKRLTAAAACTVEHDDDVACHFLNRAGWKSIRVARIESWPGGGSGGDWPDAECAEKVLWDEWNAVRINDSESEAIQFYKKNKAAMTHLMEVSWEHRYDKERGDPDAMYAAMWDRYDKGASVFSRGQQNDPIKAGVTLYTLNNKTIMDRADESRNAGDIPEWADLVLCATDINPSYALTTIIAAFGPNQRAAVVWYGTHPCKVTQEMTDAQARFEIMARLEAHGKEIAAMKCKPSHWTIDGGGTPEGTVIDFCANSVRICGLQAITSFGRSGKAYRHPEKKAKGIRRIDERSHVKYQGTQRQWILWDSHYWMEQAQRGWTGTLGAPGSCDLPKGNHREFADQVCAEQLKGKVELNGRWLYDWLTSNSIPHDYADCMAMLYMLAAVNGTGTGGRVVQVSRRKVYSQKDLRR